MNLHSSSVIMSKLCEHRVQEFSSLFYVGCRAVNEPIRLKLFRSLVVDIVVPYFLFRLFLFFILSLVDAFVHVADAIVLVSSFAHYALITFHWFLYTFFFPHFVAFASTAGCYLIFIDLSDGCCSLWLFLFSSVVWHPLLVCDSCALCWRCSRHC